MAVTNNGNFDWWRKQQRQAPGQQTQQTQQQAVPQYQPQQNRAANGTQAYPQYTANGVKASGGTGSGNNQNSGMPKIGAAPTYSQQSDPGSYSNRYNAAMNWILNQIQNRKNFKYEFNTDPLFKAYAAEYTQRGKQGMRDTMGQAASMTGGYGNSYADVAGQQTYQQYMTQLLDRGMDMRDRAYQMNQDELADLYNQYNMLAQQEQIDYQRWQDAVAAYQAWLAQQEAATGRGGGPGGGPGSQQEKPPLTGPSYQQATAQVQANNIANDQQAVQGVQNHLANLPAGIQQAIIASGQATINNPNTPTEISNLVQQTMPQQQPTTIWTPPWMGNNNPLTGKGKKRR